MYDSWIDAVTQTVEQRLSQINTNLPGKIVSYNAVKNRATVQVSIPKRLNDDESLAGPQIIEVPVVWPASGNGKASFTMPLAPGDGVMLAVQQRSLENWLDGNNTIPDDPRQFDLTDSVAFAGCSHNGTVAHDKNIVLKFDKTQISISPDNIITIGNDKGGITIDASGNITLQGQSIRVDTPARSYKLESHTHLNVASGTATSGQPVPT